MKRLAIYFYFDKDGVVNDYVPYYLDKLKEHSSELCVVVNEPLTPEGRKKLSTHCDKLLVRENIGFDSGAYKYALEYYGYEKLKEYDEILLTNFTCYGPIFPFSEMFDVMDKRECDFWGLSRHPEQPIFLLPPDKGYMYEHIQSYFVVLRKKILQDPCFEEYWKTLQTPTNYQEAIAFHEIRLTRYLEKRGFVSSAYMNFEKYNSILKGNASILMADKQLIEDRNPLVKRKLFFLDNNQWMNMGLGHTARDVFNYIKDKTDYPIEYIWDDLLRTQQMSVLRNSLHLNYYLPKNEAHYKLSTQKVALILFVYYEDLVDYCISYAKSMPKGSSIFIISAKQDLLDAYKKAFSSIDGYTIECRVMENRGRDVAAYLVAAADVYEKFDYICCMHDKKTKQLLYILTGEEFSYYCFENNLASPAFVLNVIKTFDENKRLGMLVPPTLNFSDFYPMLGNELTANKKITRDIYEKLDLAIPFDEHPVAPYGTMFWVRGAAFKSIFNHKWTYEDFPKEPLPFDGTILHAVERIYPMTSQADGFYVGWLATDEFASMYLDNQLYMLSQLNQNLFSRLGYDCFLGLLWRIQNWTNSVKFGKIIRFWSKWKYAFYSIFSQLTFGKTRLRLKQKKAFWKQIKKEFKRRK